MAKLLVLLDTVEAIQEYALCSKCNDLAYIMQRMPVLLHKQRLLVYLEAFTNRKLFVPCCKDPIQDYIFGNLNIHYF